MQIRVELNIKPAAFQSYYEGRVATIATMSDDGKRLRFPASILRPFVTHEGVVGHFILHTDDKGKLISIDRLPEERIV